MMWPFLNPKEGLQAALASLVLLGILCYFSGSSRDTKCDTKCDTK